MSLRAAMERHQAHVQGQHEELALLPHTASIPDTAACTGLSPPQLPGRLQGQRVSGQESSSAGLHLEGQGQEYMEKWI